MKSYLSQVEEFHVAFAYRQPTPVEPSFDPATNSLRVDLLREELRELQTGILSDDRTEILDALCDLEYVHAGAVLAWGLRSFFENTKVVIEQRPIPDMERHLVVMFGLLPQLEIAADMQFAAQVLTHLQLFQARLGRLVFHYGFEKFNLAFEAVHANNMLKLWTDEESDIDTKEELNALGVSRFVESFPGKWIAYRNDGKIVKPVRHAKVNLQPFI